MGDAREREESGVNTGPLCAATRAGHGLYKQRSLAGIRAVRSRRLGALEFLQKNFAYQATYFPGHQLDQGQDEKYAKQQRNKKAPGLR